MGKDASHKVGPWEIGSIRNDEFASIGQSGEIPGGKLDVGQEPASRRSGQQADLNRHHVGNIVIGGQESMSRDHGLRKVNHVVEGCAKLKFLRSSAVPSYSLLAFPR